MYFNVCIIILDILFRLFYTFCMCIFLCTETISVYPIHAVNISFVISYFGIKHMEHWLGFCDLICFNIT